MMQDYDMSGGKRVKIILTFPRCGTHFIWSRYISSGRYQLIYDADRVSALTVLADKYKGRLDFLYPSPRNPNYNFQYNSLSYVDRSLTADEHLDWLSRRYSAKRGSELFDRIMLLQDNDKRSLFSINRFIYTCSYDFLIKNYEWTIEDARESLVLFHEWLRSGRYNYNFVMVIRNIPDWIKSQMLMMREKEEYLIPKRIREMSYMLKVCIELEIPVFWMEDVIGTINDDNLDFEHKLTPLRNSDIDDTRNQLEKYYGIIKTDNMKIKQLNKAIRMDRLIQYLAEKDQIKRTSLVNSIGWLPIKMSKYIPKIKNDLDMTILNNAKVRL